MTDLGAMTAGHRDHLLSICRAGEYRLKGMVVDEPCLGRYSNLVGRFPELDRPAALTVRQSLPERLLRAHVAYACHAVSATPPEVRSELSDQLGG
jgi:hypothetical protein